MGILNMSSNLQKSEIKFFLCQKNNSTLTALPAEKMRSLTQFHLQPPKERSGWRKGAHSCKDAATEFHRVPTYSGI